MPDAVHIVVPCFDEELRLDVDELVRLGDRVHLHFVDDGSRDGTVGVAKKQVVWYPLIGVLYLLSGHLRIDRSNSAQAREGLREMGDIVRKNRLSIWMWPEGTRSRDGRLLPFKKGIIHLALQTGLPIVPVVVTGAHLAWTKNSFAVRRVPIGVHVFPAIDTSSWTVDKVDAYAEQLHQVFADALPPEQRPVTTQAA